MPKKQTSKQNMDRGSSESLVQNTQLSNDFICIVCLKDVMIGNENRIKGISYWVTEKMAQPYIDGGYCVRKK